MRFAGMIMLVVFLCLLCWFYVSKRIEAFGATSPGTMIQLKTSHVPTENDLEGWIKEGEQIKRDLASMTY